MAARYRGGIGAPALARVESLRAQRPGSGSMDQLDRLPDRSAPGSASRAFRGALLAARRLRWESSAPLRPHAFRRRNTPTHRRHRRPSRGGTGGSGGGSTVVTRRRPQPFQRQLLSRISHPAGAPDGDRQTADRARQGRAAEHPGRDYPAPARGRRHRAHRARATPRLLAALTEKEAPVRSSPSRRYAAGWCCRRAPARSLSSPKSLLDRALRATHKAFPRATRRRDVHSFRPCAEPDAKR